MGRALIAFGANLSNPKASFLAAEAQLRAQGVDLRQKSGLWSSPAWPPGSEQPDYVNAVASARYSGTPEALLDILQSIENALGRVRSVPNAARTLDLDLLTFDLEHRETTHLTLPHPRMLDRAFVLLPLCEIDTNWLKDLRKLPASDVSAMGYLGGW